MIREAGEKYRHKKRFEDIPEEDEKITEETPNKETNTGRSRFRRYKENQETSKEEKPNEE